MVKRHYIGLNRIKPVFGGFANNKDEDRHAHLPSLISAFVIHLIQSIIARLAKSKISIFWLVSLAKETSLNLTLSETSKTGFVSSRPIFE